MAHAALDDHGRRVDYIRAQIGQRTDLSASFRDRSIRDEINEEHRKLVRTLTDIKRSAPIPANNEPQNRIVGFNTPSEPTP